MAADSAELENYLRELDNVIDGGGATAAAALPGLVDGIARLVASQDAAVVGGTADRCHALLFASESPPNLLEFLRSAVATPAVISDKALADCRAKLLTFLTNHVSAVGFALGDHLRAVLDTCVHVFERDSSAAAKVAACDLLMAIIRTELLSDEELQARELQRILMEAYTTGKNRPSVRAQCLVTLGLLAETFPRTFATAALDVFKACLFNLEKEFRKRTNPDLKLITGSVNSLNHLLAGCGHCVAESEAAAVRNLFRHVFEQGTIVPPDMKRFDVPEACLRFIERHAAIFADLVADDAKGMFNRLIVDCHSRQKRVRAAAPGALRSCIAQVARKLTGDMPGERANALIVWLMKRVDAMIHGNPVFPKTVAVESVSHDATLDLQLGVQCCGTLAPALAKYNSQGTIRSLLDKLIAQCEILWDSEGSGSGSSAMYATSQRRTIQQAESLTAFCALARELHAQHLDQSVVDVFANVSAQLLFDFPRSAKFGRRVVCRAVSLVLIALQDKGDLLRGFVEAIVWPALIRTLGSVEADEGAFEEVVVDPVTGLADMRLLFKYLPLWQQLLHPRDPDTLAACHSKFGAAARLGKVASGDASSDESETGASGGAGAARLKRDSSGGLDASTLSTVVEHAGNSAGSLGAVDSVFRVLFDQLMISVLKVLSSLNLGVVDDEGEAPQSRTTVRSATSSMPTQEDESLEAGAALAPAGMPGRSPSALSDSEGETPPKANSGYEPKEAPQAQVPHDFTLFLNLTEFLQRLLPTARPALFTSWLFEFVKSCIELAHKYPHVSGFYKLIGTAVGVAQQQHAFSDAERAFAVSVEDAGGHEDGLPPAAPIADSVFRAYILVRKFACESVVRIRRHRDELQVAAMRFLLRLPLSFIDVRTMSGVLQEALKAGLSHTPLGFDAVAALERYFDFQNDALRPLLPTVLPCLSGYLADVTANAPTLLIRDDAAKGDAPGDDDAEEKNGYAPADTDGDAAIDVTEPVAGSERRRLTSRVGNAYLRADLRVAKGKGSLSLYSDVKPAAMGDSGDLHDPRELQQRVLTLIGHVGGLARHLVGSVRDAATAGLAWDVQRRVGLELSLGETELFVWLDDVLPHVVECAENSSNRRTKVTACEVLHSVVVYMFAGTARMTDDERQGSFHAIYSHLFPAMLRLASDMESVSRKLFSELSFQLIHWLTQYAISSEKDEVLVLLNAVTDGCASEAEGLRAHCANCLSEFLCWSLKHGRRGAHHAGVESLMRRINYLARHPNPFPRLGAAEAIALVCKHLWSNSEAASAHAMDLMSTTLFSLRLSAHDPSELDTPRFCARAVKNVGKVMKRHQGILAAANGDRSEHVDLASFVSWVFQQTSARETQFRKQCMALFEEFGGVKWISERCDAEGGVPELLASLQAEIPAAPPVGSGMIQNDDIFAVTIEWMERVAACLDCFRWLVACEFLAAPDVIAPGRSPRSTPRSTGRGRSRRALASESSTEEAMPDDFDDHYSAQACSWIRVVTKRYPDWNTEGPTLKLSTPFQRALLRKAKTKLVVHSFAFLAEVLRASGDAETRDMVITVLRSTEVLDTPTYSLLCKLVVDPSRGDLSIDDEGAETRVSQTCSDLLRQLLLPGMAMETIAVKSTLSELLLSPQFDMRTVELGSDAMDDRCATLVRAYVRLHRNKVLSEVYEFEAGGLSSTSTSVADIASRLGGAAATISPHAPPHIVSVGVTLIHAALELGWAVADDSRPSIAACMLDTEPFETASNRHPDDEAAEARLSEQTTKGSIFLDRYLTVILPYALERPRWETLVGSLCSSAARTNNGRSALMRVLSAVAASTSVANRQGGRASTVWRAVESVLQQLRTLSVLLSPSSSEDLLHFICDLLVQLGQLSAEALLSSSAAPVFAEFCVSFLERVFAAGVSVDLKVHATSILPFVLTGRRRFSEGFAADEDVSRRLDSAALASCRDLLVGQIPLDSTELAPGTAAFFKYERVACALLRTLVLSGSMQLLEQLLLLFSDGHRDTLSRELRSSLWRLVRSTPRAGPAPKELLEFCATKIFGDDVGDEGCLLMLCNDLGAALLDHVDTEWMFEAVASSSLAATLASPSCSSDDSMLKHLVARLQHARTASTTLEVARVAACFVLVRVIFDRATKPYKAMLCSAYGVGELKLLTKDVVTAAKDVLLSPLVVDDNAVLKFAMCSAAFTCLAVAVMRTQDKLKVYTSFLFKNLSTLWKFIVPPGDVSLDVTPPMETVAASLRKFRAGLSEGDEFVRAPSYRSAPSLLLTEQDSFVDAEHYDSQRFDVGRDRAAKPRTGLFAAASATLAQSSLAIATQDVPRAEGVRNLASASGELQASDAGTLDPIADPNDVVRDEVADALEVLETDEYNAAPAMAGVLRIIDQLHEMFHAEFGVPRVPPGEKAEVSELPAANLPQWMAILRSVLDDTDSPLNVALFVAKVVTNREHIFAPWSTQFIVPLVKTTLRTMSDRGTEDLPRFNYFVRDVAWVIIGWDHSASARLPGRDAIDRVSAWMNALIAAVPHPRRSIWKHNIETIAKLLKRWSAEPLFIDKNVIQELMGRDVGVPTDRQRSVLITMEVLSAVLRSGRPVCDPELDTGVPEPAMLTTLASGLLHKRKALYESSANVCGQAMMVSSVSGKGNAHRLLPPILHGHLEDVRRRGDDAAYLACLSRLVEHFPPFLNREVTMIVVSFLAKTGVDKALVLRVLVAQAQVIQAGTAGDINADDLFSLLREHFSVLAHHRQARVQGEFLELVSKLIAFLSYEQVMELLNPQRSHSLLRVFPHHASATCRNSLYKRILQPLWDNHVGFSMEEEAKFESADAGSADDLTVHDAAADGGGGGAQSVHGRQLLRCALLVALADPDKDIRTDAYEFWDHQERLSLEPSTRMVQLLRDVYEPEAESKWAHYSGHLMLSLAHRSADFRKPMFKNPLDAGNFKRNPIEASWSTAGSLMTPMFSAESRAPPPGFVLATVDPSLDSFSQAAGLGATLFNSFAAGTVTEGTSDIRETASTFGIDSKKKRRHRGVRISAAERSAEYFMRRNEQQKSARHALRLRRAQAKRMGVNLYRRYREGEVPDMEISRSDILVPLQALCTTEPLVARSVVTMLFTALYDNGGAGSEDDWRESVKWCLERMLDRTQFTPSFVAIVQDMCMLCSVADANARAMQARGIDGSRSWTPTGDANAGAFVVHPSLVGTAAQRSLNYGSGILLIEQGILAATGSGVDSDRSSESAARRSKARRGRRSSPGHDGSDAAVVTIPAAAAEADTIAAAWCELARLYTALGQSDVAIGIVRSTAEHEESLNAVVSENEGDFEAAGRHYREALSKYAEDESVSSLQLEAWLDGGLRCQAQLMNWDGVFEGLTVQYGEDLTSLATGEDATVGRLHLGLGYCVRACLRILCNPDSSHYSVAGALLPKMIDHAMGRADVASWVQKNLGPELALVYLLRGDLASARAQVRSCLSLVPLQWTQMHPLAMDARRASIAPLQRLVELREFLAYLSACQEHKTWRGVPRDQSDRLTRRQTGVGPTELTDAAGDPHGLLGAVLQRWDLRLASLQSATMQQWDDIVCGRRIFHAQLQQRLSRLSEEEAATGALERVSQSMIQMFHSAGEAARLHGQHVLTVRYLKAARVHMLAIGQTGETVAQLELRSRSEGSRALRFAEPSMQLRYARSAMRVARKQPCDASARASRRRMQLVEAEASHRFVSLLLSNPELRSDSETELAEEIQRAYTAFSECCEVNMSSSGPGGPSGLPRQISRPAAGAVHAESLAGASGRSLRRVKPRVRERSSDTAVAVPTRADTQDGGVACFRFAGFCADLLRRWRSTAAATAGDDGLGGSAEVAAFATSVGLTQGELAARTIDAMLTAADAGCSAAIQRMPMVLELTGEFEDCRRTFSLRSAQLPVWMFLPWVSQLVGLLRSPECADVVVPVLTRLLQAYPQGVHYALRTSLAAAGASVPSSVVSTLQRGLANRAIDDFITAIGWITDSAIQWKDGMRALSKLFKSKLSDAELQEAYRNFAPRLLSAASSSEAGSIAPNVVGSAHASWGRKWAKKLVTHFGVAGEKVSRATLQKYFADQPARREKDAQHGALRGAELVDPIPRDGRVPLAQFSPFLAEWAHRVSGHATQLELPGQYDDCFSEPEAAAHTLIAAFGPSLLVLRSLRRPKRLTAIGNDEREYHLLVKSGEDLRLDQRIEQLFRLMNRLFASNPESQRRGLSLKTYTVAPFDPNLGVIEWVPDTTTVKSVVESEYQSLSAGGAANSLDQLPGAKLMHEWLVRVSGKDARSPLNALYEAVFVKAREASADAVAASFREMEQSLPDDLLRRRILSLATGADAFVTLRQHFSRSFAALTIAGYIVGLGDRHLDNFLFDSTDCSLVGIDFGAAFGFATTALPVPEVIPARITRQFTSILQPLRSTHVMQHDMVVALTTLRNNRFALLDVLEVFLKDPLVDWLPPSKVQRESRSSDSQHEAVDSPVAARRIDRARRKLDLGNPAVLLVDELNESKISPAWRDSAANLVRGPRSALRRSSPCNLAEGRCSSVDLQVGALIELATDPELLIRSWRGLRTWV